jgi:hypothetical protein
MSGQNDDTNDTQRGGRTDSNVKRVYIAIISANELDGAKSRQRKAAQVRSCRSAADGLSKTIP